MKASAIVKHLLEADLDDPESFMQNFNARFAIVRGDSGSFYTDMGGWRRNNIEADLFSREQAEKKLITLQNTFIIHGMRDVADLLRIEPYNPYTPPVL